MKIEESLKVLGLKKENFGTSTGKNFFGAGKSIESYSPADGKLIGSVSTTTAQEYERVVKTAQAAYVSWRMTPAPKRGEMVRQFGDKLRAKKQELGQLVSYEMGKSLQEGLG